eukprot:364786-Chlamydomonas_euryale.AAC.10
MNETKQSAEFHRAESRAQPYTALYTSQRTNLGAVMLHCAMDSRRHRHLCCHACQRLFQRFPHFTWHSALQTSTGGWCCLAAAWSIGKAVLLVMDNRRISSSHKTALNPVGT